MVTKFLLCSTLFFGAALIVVVIPSLYIADLDDARVYLPADAVSVNADTTSTSPGIKQRLFLVFMIPFAGVCNAVWVYLSYYRHVRNVFYRMEVAELDSSRVAVAAKPVMKLVKAYTPPQQQHHADRRESAAAHHSGGRGQLTADSSHAFAPAHQHSSREPSTALSSSSQMFQETGSFVLAALPSAVEGGGLSNRMEWMQHRRRADVSRETCPRPIFSCVASLVDYVDKVIEEGGMLRSAAAAEILRRIENVRQDIQRQEEADEVSASSPSGLGSASPSMMKAVVQSFTVPPTLASVREELEELRVFASWAPSGGGVGGSCAALPTNSLPTDQAGMDGGSPSPLHNANDRNGSPTDRGGSRAGSKAARMKRAGSRIVFTRSRSRQRGGAGGGASTHRVPSSRGTSGAHANNEPHTF